MTGDRLSHADVSLHLWSNLHNQSLKFKIHIDKNCAVICHFCCAEKEGNWSVISYKKYIYFKNVRILNV